MRIALAQLNYRIGDFEGNIEKIGAAIERARKQKAELVVFSELAVTGYYPIDLLERKEFIERAGEAVSEIARMTTGIGVILGAPALNESERGKRLFNAAFYLEGGEVRDVFYKSLLPTYDVFDEYRHFEPNREFRLLEMKGHRIAVTICEDLWDEQPVRNEFARDKLYQVSPVRELASFNPELIINISASPFSAGQETSRKEILVAKASQYQLPVIYVNQAGAQAELIFDGGSLFILPNGEINQELCYFGEDFRVVETDGTSPRQVQPLMEEVEKISHALVLGIRDYFSKTGFSRAVLGLSGGIDSAVVAVLGTEALGAANVRVLMMPSRYSSAHSLEDAVTLAENLGIRYDIVPIQESVDSINRDMARVYGDLPPDITEENIQARIRGVLIMALANKTGAILLNTSNKSECAVGYGTLYGDMNGGLAVLGDVYKTGVYKLADFINRKKEIIPRNTIIKPPSAELKAGQKDTDSLPDYSLLDEILSLYIEGNRTPADIESLGFNPEMITSVVNMVNRNEYKRFQAAPILRISSKAFGFGRRMPLVAKF